MKALISSTIAATLIASNLTIAEPYLASDTGAAESKSFGQRFSEAILPGLRRPSAEPYGYAYAPSRDNVNAFQASFKDGRSRAYVSADEDSPFVADPHTPTGNVFDFRY